MSGRSLILMGVIAVAGCRSVNPEAPRTELGELLEDRAGATDVIAGQQDEESQAQVRERVDALASQPLTAEAAVQIALLNNREFLAVVEDLGIAQADLVQAGLLENPVLAGDIVNSTKGNGLGGGLSISTSLLSVFLIPAKLRLAKSELAHAVLSVGQASLMLVRDVKEAYAETQAADAVLGLQRDQARAAELAAELVQLQFEAGNVSPLDVQLFAAALDEARVAFADAQSASMIAHEELTQLLGLWGEQAQWTLAPMPSGPLPAQPELRGLEQRGIRERLDISAQRAVVTSMEYAIELRRRGLVPQVEIGAEGRNEVGNDAGHEWVLGPSLAIEIPIFDPGHADFARLRAQLRQAQHRLQSKSVAARSEIRAHRRLFVASRQKVEYLQQTMLPRAEAIAALTMRRYNSMLVGTYQLLETREDQIELQRELAQAIRDYWVARADLEFAIGGRLPSADTKGGQ